MKKLRITCETHGELVNEEVFCQHEVEGLITKVADAHRLPYGANCTSLMTVYLDGDQQFTSTISPPVG